MTKPQLSLLLLSGLSLAPMFASAAPKPLSLASELSDPQTRLLAVAFVGRRCPDCKAERATWRRLLKKHRREGLRVIVVAEANAKGRCRSPGWTPSKRICDRGGRLRERFGVSSYPAAFLWSWRGQLLVNKGSASEVLGKAERWLDQALRVAIHDVKLPEGDRRPSELRYLLRAELQATGRFTLLASAEERAALRDAQRRSMGKSADPRRAARVGRDLTENAQLSAVVLADQLYLQLFDVQTKRMIAQGQTPWDSKAPRAPVKRAVAQLLAQLKQPLETPNGGTVKGWLQAPAPGMAPTKAAGPATSPGPAVAPASADPAQAAVLAPPSQPPALAPTTSAPAPTTSAPAPNVSAPATNAPASPPASPTKPSNAWMALGLGPGIRTVTGSTKGHLGLGADLHLEWGLRGSVVGFGLTGDLGLAAFSGGMVEIPVYLGVRLYLWRVFVGLGGGLNLVGGDGPAEDETISGGKRGLGSISLGYAGQRWQVALRIVAENATDADKAGWTGADADRSSRATSSFLHVGWRF